MSFPSLFNLNSLINLSKPSKLFPYSRMLFSCLRIMYEYGYISSFKEKTINNFRFIEVFIKFDKVTKRNPLNSVKYLSIPSRKMYFNHQQLAKIYAKNRNKLFIISTSFFDKESSIGGIMAIDDAIRYKVGGELLCEIF